MSAPRPTPTLLLPAVQSLVPSPRSGAIVPGGRVALPSAETEEQAKERYEIICPIFDFKRNPGGFAHMRTRAGLPVTSEARLLVWLSERSNTSVPTLKRWKSRWMAEGLPGLADKPRSDKGHSRFFDQYRRAAMVAAWLYLEQRQRPRICFEHICNHRELLGIPEAELPSYETVRAWLNNDNTLSPAMRTLARDGRRAFQERFAPYLSRGYTEFANDIWVSDHMICDVEVRNTLFPEAEWGAPIRLRMTTMLDFRSRFVPGVSFCWEGSSRSITTALRRAVTDYGPCLTVYADNGKDFKKAARGAAPAWLLRSPIELADWHARELEELAQKGVLARLGIAAQHCLPFHPQSKHVERYHRTYHERFDRLWTEHYTGGEPGKRPDITTVSMAEHRKLVKHGMAHMSRTPSDRDYIANALQWIYEYNHRPMGENVRGVEGLSPAEVFESEQNPETRPTPDTETLALMLYERERRQVSECGVKLDKRRYVAHDQDSLECLTNWGGREVEVAYDPLDREEVAILSPDGNLLCWAKAERLLPQSPEANEMVAESMAGRRRVERNMRDALTGLNREVARLCVPTPLEDLQQRALAARAPGSEANPAASQLPAAVGEVLTFRKQSLRPDDNAVAPAPAAQIADGILERLLGK